MQAIIGIPVLHVNRYSGMHCCDNTDMTIGDRLKEARKDAKLTQIDLAKRSGVKQSTISDLEVGNTRGTTNIAQLASVLSVSALWLETGRGDKSPKSVQPEIALAPAQAQAEPALQWINAEEARLLSNYRAATAGWKGAIQDFANNAEKDPLVRIADNKS
jgi:transcriptional regulator with XRE-family HTH domain